MTQTDHGSRRIIAFSSLLLAIFLIWANFTELDLVTRGQGRVVPHGQNVSVQVPHAGKVLRFDVAAGDEVSAGQIIAAVDPVAAEGALAEAQKRQRALQARLARLDSEMAGQVFDTAKLAPADPIERSLLEAEAALSLARRANLAAKEASHLEVRSQKQRELQGAIAEFNGLLQQKVLQDQEAKQLLPLVKLGALGVSEKFRIERQSNESATQILVLTERQNALGFAIKQTEAEITSARAEQRNTILDDRVETLSQLAELSERMPTLEQRVKESVVYAPVQGTINQVFFGSIGAVVSDGEIIAEIVPSTADLRIETLVSPSDIANIEPDQKVRISLTAFEAAKYGTIPGRVIRVSADASVQDSSQNRMFIVDCSIEGGLTLEDGSRVTIKPGMVAQVDIVRGRRSVLEYFWNPIVKMKDRALRE